MKYDPDVVAEVLAKRKAGFARAGLAREYKIDASTIKRWEKESAEAGAAPVSPTDLVQLGGKAPAGLIGTLQNILAEQMPTGTPADLWKAALMQKLVKALEGTEIPKPKTMADFKTLVNLGSMLLGITGTTPKKAAPSVTLRFDRLGVRPGGVVDVPSEVVVEE